MNINAQTKDETKAAIKETVLNYIEGFYQADAERMDKALHPELAKRVIRRDQEGNCFINPMVKTQLVFYTKHNKNQNELNKEEEFKAEITIFDIYENIASVKATTNKFAFIDYIHLGKFNGEWKIINVLWEPFPRKEK